MPRPSEVFVSHSHRNNKFVNELADVLSDHGIGYFLSGRSIRSGQDPQRQIGEALLERCDWFLLILSPQAVDSRWVGWEYHKALSLSRYDDRVLPCWWRKCELKGAFWNVDMIQTQLKFIRNKEAGFRRLVEDVWGLEYRC